MKVNTVLHVTFSNGLKQLDELLFNVDTKKFDEQELLMVARKIRMTDPTPSVRCFLRGCIDCLRFKCLPFERSTPVPLKSRLTHPRSWHMCTVTRSVPCCRPQQIRLCR